MSPICPTSIAAAESLAIAKHAAPESLTVVDVLTAEDAGKFPHRNVAEILQRVSSVSISREFGEGARVSLRDYLMLPI